MLIKDIKEKFFKGDYYNAIRIKTMEELEKLIYYFQQDPSRFDAVFNRPYDVNICDTWKLQLEENLKKARYKFLAIRYHSYHSHSRGSKYLESTSIEYSDLSHIDRMLDMIDNYEKRGNISEKEKELISLLDELGL